MWNSLYFIFFLWEQDKDDDDGLEYYVRHKLYTDEITWFPMHKAMCLNQEISGTEKTTHDLKATMQESHTSLATNVVAYQEDISHLLHNLTHTLADENFSGGSDLYAGATDEKGRYDGVDSEEEWNPSWGYNLSVSVRAIKNIDIPDNELSTLNFRLISDAGLHNGNAVTVEPLTKTANFNDEERFLVAESFVEGEQGRSIQFQILQSTGAGISKFVSVIEVNMALIMAGEDGAELAQSFENPGQTSMPTLVLGCYYDKATVAGVADDDESEG
jgi:hypothetical protein